MQNDRWPKRMSVWNPTERRKSGPSKRNWREVVDTSIGFRGLQERDWNLSHFLKTGIRKLQRSKLCTGVKFGSLLRENLLLIVVFWVVIPRMHMDTDVSEEHALAFWAEVDRLANRFSFKAGRKDRSMRKHRDPCGQ